MQTVPGHIVPGNGFINVKPTSQSTCANGSEAQELSRIVLVEVLVLVLVEVVLLVLVDVVLLVLVDVVLLVLVDVEVDVEVLVVVTVLVDVDELDDVDVDVLVLVEVVVLVLVDVAVGAAVGQSPIASSSSFVFAPEMQVPSGPLVVTALLQPHSPVQSFPHLITLQGSGAGAAVGAGVGAAVGATAVPSSEVQVLSPTVFGLALLARFAHSSQVWPPMLHPLQSGHPTPRMQVLSEQRGLHRAVGE